MSKTLSPKTYFLIAFLILVFLIVGLGPTLFLNLLLAKMIPAATGTVVSYDRARAGLFLQSARIEGFRLEMPGGAGRPQSFQASYLGLEGLSVTRLVRLLVSPESLAAGPLFLAEELRVENFRHQDGPTVNSLEKGYLRGLSLVRDHGLHEPPVHFDKLEVGGLEYLAARPDQNYVLAISDLEARGLDSASLAELKIRALDWQPADQEAGEAPTRISIGGLTVGGLKIEALSRTLAGGPGPSILWWVLSGSDSLELARAGLWRGGNEALGLKSALFDYHEEGPEISFVRRLEFSADLPSLAATSAEPLWSDFIDLFGRRPRGEVVIEYNYDRTARLALLQSARLELPDLGRLELGGSLAGVSALAPHSSPSQFLYDARNWRLSALALDFQDNGFMANYYRHLNRTVFEGRPGYQTVDNLMAEYIDPWARKLEYEEGLANLPALRSEVEVFLRRPERFRINCRPAEPLPLLLANMDKYDIIDKLRLTLEVNDRAPVAVAVASGVFQERLPSSPRPMEKLFTEEDI